jgi:hypothetical protein
VAAIAKLRLSLQQQTLRLLGMVRRMAVQAADIIAVMRRLRETPLLMRIAVTAQTACDRVLARQALEADYLADIAAALYVSRTWPMTGLATMTLI